MPIRPYEPTNNDCVPAGIDRAAYHQWARFTGTGSTSLSEFEVGARCRYLPKQMGQTLSENPDLQNTTLRLIIALSGIVRLNLYKLPSRLEAKVGKI